MDPEQSSPRKTRKRKRELMRTHAGTSSGSGSGSGIVLPEIPDLAHRNIATPTAAPRSSGSGCGGPASGSGLIVPSRSKNREEQVEECVNQNGTDNDPPCPCHTLPIEILQELFSYLDFGDRREARLVCKRWNAVITSWPAFIGKLFFLLRRSPSSNTHAILNCTVVPYRHIKLGRFIGTKPPNWYFPNHVSPSVTTLVLVDGTFNWSWFKEAVTRFPCLENLSLVNCARQLEEDEGWSQTGDQVLAFEALRRRLKVFHLKFTTSEFQNLNFYLKQICDPESVLRELKIVHKYPSLERNITIDQEKLVSTLTVLLTNCTATMRSLICEGTFRFINAVCTSIGILEQKRIRLHLNTFHLQEGNDDLINPAAISPLNEAIYVEFLRNQPNLKSLVPPRFTLLEFRNDNFVEALPNNLRSFGGNISVVSPGLFTKFQQLDNMKINFLSGTMTSNFVDAIDAKIYPELKTLTIYGKPQQNLVVPLVVAFPNLVTLVINFVAESNSQIMINNENLQMIITTLSNLQVLKLNSCQYITDEGVSGIPADEATKLQSSKGLYLEVDPLMFGITRTGSPLSSLTYLKELSLTFHLPAGSGRDSLITDVGIFYGLAFKDLRKLDISCGNELSDWGLVQIGRLNPCLEHCFVYTDSKLITPAGKTLLDNILPRTSSLHTLKTCGLHQEVKLT